MPSSMSCGQAALGAKCRPSLRPGAPLTGGSRLWRDASLFERLNHTQVMADRERVGRAASPSAAVLDGQSENTTGEGGSREYGP